MTPSLGPEAERELTDSALYYAREANAELGLAFIETFERALDLLCSNPQLLIKAMAPPSSLPLQAGSRRA